MIACAHEHYTVKTGLLRKFDPVKTFRYNVYTTMHVLIIQLFYMQQNNYHIPSSFIVLLW